MGELTTSKLAVVCSEVQTRDYIPDDMMNKKFKDVSDWLWKKYDNEIKEHLKRLGNMEGANRKRAPLSMGYIDENGKEKPIPHEEDIINIAKKTDTIFWHPEPTGGANHLQTFGIHAKEIIGNVGYGNWKLITEGKYGDGIWAKAPDPKGFVHIWKIFPSIGYPYTPPIVTAEPQYTDDICWRSGKLDYTKIREDGSYYWTRVVMRSSNPLLLLIIELFNKYDIGV